MAKRTQKAGATAKFGARYGVSVKKKFYAENLMAKKRHCTHARYYLIQRKSRDNLLEFRPAVSVVTLFAGGVGAFH